MTKGNLSKISKVFYINLDRREDRREYLEETLNFKAERFQAVDSKSIVLNDSIKKLFPSNYHKLKKSEIACCLIHYALWQKLVSDKDAENYLILEDDVVFKSGFKGFWNAFFSENMPKDYFLIYLGGCQPWNKIKYHEVIDPYNQYFNNIKKNNFFTKGDHYWHMNAQSYVLSKRAASLMCQWAEQHGFAEALDIFMINFVNDNKLFSAHEKLFHLNPLMTYQMHEENDNPAADQNSDIRFDEEKFEHDSVRNKESELGEVNKIKMIWQNPGGKDACYERDWILELFEDVDLEHMDDPERLMAEDNSIVVYSDMFGEDPTRYPEHLREKLNLISQKQKSYFRKFDELNNCFLVHLCDEYCQANVRHYKYFKHVFRNYYRSDVEADNVTFIPLGYKRELLKKQEQKKISVIVPTVWAANDYMMKSLLHLDKVECIEEVIVIDNDKTKTPNWIQASEKVKLIDPGKRMYFNESVNFGIDLCKNDICCIYNDDITSDTRVFDYVRKNLTEKDGCIFISPKYINKGDPSSGNLKKVNDNVLDGLRLGSGMMMFLRKQGFVKIPRELVHHFGDTFIFEINKRQGKQNYIVEGFPIETPGSASENNSVKQVIKKDWQIQENIFQNLDYYLGRKAFNFPFIKNLSNKSITKKIHLSWKNKNILDSDSYLISNGVGRLQELNPDWEIEVSDDEDVNKLLRDSIGLEHWNLIKDKKIVERTDLWRLLKIHQEGGLYIDIDRYINIPLKDILKPKTKCVIPVFKNVDFSQDFILSTPKSEYLGVAIANNLKNRKAGKSLFYTAVYSYMHSVSRVLSGEEIDRNPGQEYWNKILPKLESCEYIETKVENGPFDNILFQFNIEDFNFVNSKTNDPQKLMQEYETQKGLFYNEQNVKHWNQDDQKKFKKLNER